MADVVVREVGLREGLQILPDIVPTGRKTEWIARLVQSGLAEIEVTSLVPAKYLPQFADSETLVSAVQSIEGLSASVLVPNLAGARRALNLGVAQLTFAVSATEAFSAANLRCTRAQSIESFCQLGAMAAGTMGPKPRLTAGISNSFGCAREGRVEPREVVWMVEALHEAGAEEFILADTIGAANPAQVRALLSEVMDRVNGADLTLHLHDTRGLGLANVVAGLDAGVRRFESSIGGVGGCPNSPGSTGNIVTEDLVFMLEAMGLSTGIDLEALCLVGDDIEQALPHAGCHSAIRRAGAPKWLKPERTRTHVD